ncbi:MAG: hypothetical protein ACO2PN_13510 [Pyrobaculum sp.]
MSLALALVLLGVAAVMLYYFNPQQPLDHAKAAFYPLVKPLNATHVWLGVKPSADKVEVVELKYQYRGRWVDVPVARLTADRAVWLNATDGRPVAVPCSANVTVATRHGTAARSLSFTPVCLQRDNTDVADVTEVFRQLTDYASYVANYVLYKSIPAITAYVRFGSMYVGIQNIAPFAFQALQNVAVSNWQMWPPDYNAINLIPLEARDIWSGASAELVGALRVEDGDVASVMYRWINVVVDWDSVLRIWVNNVLVYNGTPPQRAATFTTPQGFRITFTPIDANTANVTLYYWRYKYDLAPCNCLWVRDRPVWDKAVSLIATRGRASSWSGWVRMINVPGPRYGEAGFTRTIHVMPPAPYQGGDKRLFGAVTPFVVRSLTALRSSNGTVFASYADENGAVKMLTFNTPNGTFYLEEPLHRPNNVPLGFRQVVYIYADTTRRGDSYAIALGFAYQRVCLQAYCNRYQYQWVPHIVTEGRARCVFRGNWPYSSAECVAGGRVIWISWSIDRNGVVSVYKDGVLQRNTRLGQLSAALAWTPDGRMYIASPGKFYYNRIIYGHGSSYIIRSTHYEPPIRITSDTVRVSAPFAYRWSLSGAYNYTLTLSIAFDRKLLRSTQLGRTVYELYNVTYRGVMNLTYNGEPAALDAFYGWYYMVTTYTLPPPPPPPAPPPRFEYSGGGSVSICTPTRIKIGEDQEHRELNTGSNSYSVQVVNYDIIRVTGCGYDYTYRKTTYVRTLTADGNIYQVTDPCRRVCGFGQARTCNGVVYCGSCTCE